MVELVEALDVVGHAVPLQHVLALRDRGHGVDLQVWGSPGSQGRKLIAWVVRVGAQE